MNKIIIIAAFIFGATIATAADQIFTAERLVHWPKSLGDNKKATKCDEYYKAFAKQEAMDLAMAKCESTIGMNECLIKKAIVTYNGIVQGPLAKKYGLNEEMSFGVVNYGCEASAIVYGFE